MYIHTNIHELLKACVHHSYTNSSISCKFAPSLMSQPTSTRRSGLLVSLICTDAIKCATIVAHICHHLYWCHRGGTNFSENIYMDPLTVRVRVPAHVKCIFQDRVWTFHKKKFFRQNVFYEFNVTRHNCQIFITLCAHMRVGLSIGFVQGQPITMGQ